MGIVDTAVLSHAEEESMRSVYKRYKTICSRKQKRHRRQTIGEHKSDSLISHDQKLSQRPRTQGEDPAL